MDDMNYGNFENSDSNKQESINRSESIPVNIDHANGNYSSASFYTETYKKQKVKRNISVFQLLLVSLVSSILGAAIMFAATQIIVPGIEPTVRSFFGIEQANSEVLSGSEQQSNSESGASNEGYKKIEIEKTDSPVAAIAEKVTPSVVGISISFQAQNRFFGGQQGIVEGSGIIVSSDGYIMTNRHVVANGQANGSRIQVFIHGQKDKPYDAKIVGISEETDLAVLKIEATGLHPAELGDSNAVKVGELAVAIGNPGGLDLMGSVTAGIISGKDREIVSSDGTEIIALQTDAAINSGNSGGALVNSQGQVIGINTLKGNTQMGFEGLGFAIPINYAGEIIDGLIKRSTAPIIGVTIDTSYTIEVAKQQGWPEGLFVSDVQKFKSAHMAGIQPNDIITEFDGQRVTDYQQLTDIRLKHKPGDVIKVKVYRNGEYLEMDVKLMENK